MSSRKTLHRGQRKVLRNGAAGKVFEQNAMFPVIPINFLRNALFVQGYFHAKIEISMQMQMHLSDLQKRAR